MSNNLVEMLINGSKVVKGEPSQAPARDFLFVGSLTAATDTTVGGVLKLENTFDEDLLITDLILDVTTEATGAGTIDAGVDDDGADSSDNLIDGLDVGTAAIVASNLTDPGTNGGIAKWASGEYLVITASADLTGLVGTYKVRAIPQ